MKILFAYVFFTLLHTLSIIGNGQEIYVQTGHTASIVTIAFAPDNRTFATAGEDKTIKLYDAATGAEFLTLAGHTGGVSSVVFSPNGKTLASGSFDGSVRLWDIAQGKEIPFLTEKLDFVTGVAFSPDGKSLAVGAWNGVSLIDVNSKQIKFYGGVQQLETCCRVWTVAFSADGKKIIFGGQEFGKGFVRIVSLPSGEIGELEGAYRDNFPPVYSVAVSSDNFNYAIGTQNGTRVVRFDKKGLEPPEGKWIEKFADHISRSVVFQPKSNALITGGSLNFFDILTGKKTKSLNYDSFAHAISPDGKTLVAVNTAKEITIWDTVSGKLKKTIKPAVEEYKNVWLDAEGKYVAGIKTDNSAVFWELAADGEPQSFRSPPINLTVDESTDGSFKVSADSVQNGNNQRIFLNAGSAVIEPNDTLTKAQNVGDTHGYFGSMAIETYIYEDETAKIYNRYVLETNGELSGRFLIAAVSPDGKKLATLAVSDSLHLRTASVGTFEIKKEERKFIDGRRVISSINSIAASQSEKPNGYFTVLKKHFEISLDYEKQIPESIAERENELAKIATEIAQDVPRFLVRWNALLNKPTTGDGKFQFKLAENGTIKILDGKTGVPLANLYKFGEKDWLVTTPEGLFDGSREALKQIVYRHEDKTLPFEKIEFYANQFNYPGLLPAIMSGKPLVKKEITPLPFARIVDEFGLINNGEIKARIDAYLNELNNDPSAQGLIIFYSEKGKPAQTKRLITVMRDYMFGMRKFDSARINVTGGGVREKMLFQLYVVPAGAETPSPMEK